MNRAEHLLQLLTEHSPQCGFDLWRPLGTAPMRAFFEARKAGLPVENVLDEHGKRLLHRHGNASYAVYQLRPEGEHSRTFNELQDLKGKTEPVSRADRPEETQPAQLQLIT